MHDDAEKPARGATPAGASSTFIISPEHHQRGPRRFAIVAFVVPLVMAGAVLLLRVERPLTIEIGDNLMRLTAQPLSRHCGPATVEVHDVKTRRLRPVKWPEAARLGRMVVCKARRWILVLFGMSILMAAIAVGLFQYRAWARHAAISWGMIGLVLAGYLAFYVLPEVILEVRRVCEILVENPARAELYCPGPSIARRLIMFAALGFYPVLIASYFALPRVRAAMRG